MCPDEWAEPLADALAAMVDAPLDDIDWDPQPLTPEQVRDRLRAADREGFDVVTTLALAPDGSAAGVEPADGVAAAPVARSPGRHRRGGGATAATGWAAG